LGIVSLHSLSKQKSQLRQLKLQTFILPQVLESKSPRCLQGWSVLSFQTLSSSVSSHHRETKGPSVSSFPYKGIVPSGP
jgi:hypothetical protein